MIFTKKLAEYFILSMQIIFIHFLCVFSESKIWKQYSNYKTLTKQRNTTLVQITNN